MACPHKFHDYLNLRKGYLNPALNELDFEPTTLIVGTFNPSWPENNKAEWFYGRTRNNYLWDVLPRLYNANNLRKSKPQDWRQFCFTNKIALTDLITSIEDADQSNEEHQDVLATYLDTSIADYFSKFTFTPITEILEKYNSITAVYLTRQKGVELFDKEWEKVEKFKRNLHVRDLLTPSASARFQIRDYKMANPNDKTPLLNFIYQSWKEQWHF